MALNVGDRLGSYEILSAIGAGGMGEVYRARDRKLNREVAIKVLPERFALDPDRLARFTREAQVLASLNHPHIAAIYGLEETDGVQPPSQGFGEPGRSSTSVVRALVMELVEGPTLADVIATHNAAPSEATPQGSAPSATRGATARGGVAPRGMGIDEALPIARQIAEALEAAHEQGIIHRDLKPANIKVRDDGTVKVLDFGLAKLTEAGRAGGAGQAGGADGLAALSQSPTITSPAGMTAVGMLLGTAAYMSPEQAKGRPADKRSDVWAFGCVLYEMLTGKRPFDGEDVSDTLAAVLRGEPDWTALPPNVRPSIHTLVRCCLEKDRRRRIADISTALFVLDEASSLSPELASVAATPAAVVPRQPAWRRLAPHTLAWLIGGALAGSAVWLAMRPTPPRVTRTTITPSSEAALAVSGLNRDLAITPDGRTIVYVGNNGTQLFVRAMDRLEPTVLSGLGIPRSLFVSPDGQWIGFADGSSLKKVAITGGPAVTICSTPSGVLRGATWGPDGTIIFAGSNTVSGLWSVSASGGEPAMLTKPDRERGEGDHLWPEFLPGAQAVLFTITPVGGSIDNAQVAVLDLRTGMQKILMRGGSHAHYLPSGHLVYGVGGTLRAVAFNLARLEMVGTPIPVVPQVYISSFGGADFDVAGDGTLAYVSGGAQSLARTLTWVDRQGREEPILAPARVYTYPRISPEGTRIALDIRDQENDIWMWHLVRQTLTRVTFDPGLDTYPVWTPDGRRVIFSSERAGTRNLFWQAADGTGTAEGLTQSPNVQWPTSASPDGTQVVLREAAPTSDLMMLVLDKDRVQPPSQGVGEPGRSSTSEVRPPSSDFGAPRPLVQTSYVEDNAEISPDGRFVAYESNSSGQNEIYVRPFPNVDSGLWQVSTTGGSRPLWARNGQELFYLSQPGVQTGALMSVRIERGTTWAAGTPTKLFEGRYFTGGGGANFGRTYDVSPDGRRFLMIKAGGGGPGETVAPANLIVVQNWFEELKRLVPVN